MLLAQLGWPDAAVILGASAVALGMLALTAFAIYRVTRNN
jgi:hypothetical protein